MATATFELKAVGFRDSEGILRADTIRESSDTVWLEGWYEDDWVAFESEAYHLRDWCEHYGFPYFESEPVEFDLELEEQ